MKIMSVWACFGLLWVGSAIGQEQTRPNDPVELLKTQLDAATSILGNKELDLATKEKQINEIVNPLFDFSLMAKLSLGKTQWVKSTRAQRDRFVSLFVEQFKDSYRDKLSLYSGEKLIVKPAKPDGSKISIPTELITQDRTIEIIYKLYKTETWKIYDLEIEGVSILKTYQSQFTEVLSKGSIEDLLAQLEKKTPSAKDSPNTQD